MCQTPAAPVVLAWLIPLTRAETHVAHTQGWAALEAVFVHHNPDLTNPQRPTVQLPDPH